MKSLPVIAVVVIAVALAVPARAQDEYPSQPGLGLGVETEIQPPAAPLPLPRPHSRLGRAEWTLLAADATARTLDTISTRRMLARGGHEMVLPGFVAGHTTAMAAYSGGVVALQYWGARRLEARGPRRMAKWLLTVDATGTMPWAVRNFWVRGRQAGSGHDTEGRATKR